MNAEYSKSITLIPLTKEKALEAMKAGERLVNGKDSPDISQYRWDGEKIVAYDSYYVDSAETVPESQLPQLYRQETASPNPIHEAIIFAARKHAGQVRKGTDTPYFSHPAEVMQILTANGCPEKVIISGILHDTLEDTETAPEEIRSLFGEDILRIVQAESEDKSKSWKERKQAAIDRLAGDSLEARLVCCADKLSNLRSMAADREAVGERLWERFNAPKADIEWYYRGIAAALGLPGYKMFEELTVRLEEVFR